MFLESRYIKWKKPKLNWGITATKELILFFTSARKNLYFTR